MDGRRRHTFVTPLALGPLALGPLALGWLAACAAIAEEPAARVADNVPDWAADAVWYQVFPERFANGDPTNDPTRESLEFPARAPTTWSVTRWTADWYARAPWERAQGGDFYSHGVFDRRFGGDLAGLRQRLDYLVELGVNTVYLNPVFHAASLHKYDAIAMHHIDPHFGPDPGGDLALVAGETDDPATWRWTAADKLFLDLVREFQERGVRVVIDGVFNHTGRGFFAFRDLVERGASSAYRDWYVVRAWDDPGTPRSEFRYEGWWGAETLPIFADAPGGEDLAAGPKAYVLAVTRRWMDPDGDGDPSDGISGWRLDVAPEAPLGFWRDWNAAVRRLNPAAVTVAEHWDDAAEFLVRGGFTATMNYHGFALPVKGFVIDGAVSASDFASLLIDRAERHGAERRLAQLNLIDSHDTERVASMVVNARGRLPYGRPDRFDYDHGRTSARNGAAYDVRKPTYNERRLQRIVALLQATCVGAPMVYYGDEAGLWGGDDPDDRKPMLWPELDYDPERSHPGGARRPDDVVGFDRDLFNFYQQALALRRYHAPLRRGDFEVVGVDDEAGALVFRRSLGGETVYVALNRGDGPWSGEIESPAGASLREVFTASGQPHRVRVEPAGEGVRLTLPERDAAVLVEVRG